MDFRQALECELASRRARNPQYSLRAFARYLGTDHSTLSQILRGRRSLSPRMVRVLGKQLRLSQEVIVEACVEQDSRAVLRLIRSRAFRPDARWIATRSGIALDGVNAALHWLLYSGKLVMASPQRWIPISPPVARRATRSH